mmetsp:Transcript_20981/g.44073  ORF Transcript_20981/g.44073 Transcript_20981/m.44073 type:complete len:88 (+) Transcript_20981:154-417(+)
MVPEKKLRFSKEMAQAAKEIEFGTDVPEIQGLGLNVSLCDLFFGAREIQGKKLKSALHRDHQIGIINLAMLQKEILQNILLDEHTRT